MSAPLITHLAELCEHRPDVLAAVLTGDVTLTDAQQLLDGTSPHSLDLLKESYDACRATMLSRDSTLLDGLPTTVKTLEDELVRHPVSSHFFQEGRITLLQMYYGTRLALDADAIEICIARGAQRRETELSRLAREAVLEQFPVEMREKLAHTPTEHLRLALPAHRSVTPA